MYNEIIVLGVILSLLFAEITGISPAGLVVAGYMALSLQTAPAHPVYPADLFLSPGAFPRPFPAISSCMAGGNLPLWFCFPSYWGRLLTSFFPMIRASSAILFPVLRPTSLNARAPENLASPDYRSCLPGPVDVFLRIFPFFKEAYPCHEVLDSIPFPQAGCPASPYGPSGPRRRFHYCYHR